MAGAGLCPICKQPTVTEFRPFCSKRCADIDLARWLGGAYAIAATTDDDDEDGETAHTGAEADAKPGTVKTGHGGE